MAFADSERRVRPRKDFSEDEASLASSLYSPVSEKNDDSEEFDAVANSEGEPSGYDGETLTLEEDVNSVSFGALVKAQESLERRHSINAPSATGFAQSSSKTRVHHRSEDQKGRDGPKDTQNLLRSSKHAPAEMSSKKTVSRHREVVSAPKIKYRDPRFDPLSGHMYEAKIQQNYAFLDAYRDSEITSLKTAISKTKDEVAKTELKTELLRLESRKKTQEAKAQRQEVLRAHRAQEKTLIQQGKKPFYLKKAEQKKRALLDKYQGMSAKQVDRAIERRRKKKAGRERRRMPGERRSQGT